MIQPKEKAIELYDKIWNKFPAQSAIHFDLKPFVKDCCIFLVDEVLDAMLVEKASDTFLDWEIDYYNKVKTEIEKL